MVRQQGVGDAGARPVPGFPYLRVDRFLASFRAEVKDEAAFREWAGHLRRLDQEARRIELQNLPRAERAEICC